MVEWKRNLVILAMMGLLFITVYYTFMIAMPNAMMGHFEEQAKEAQEIWIKRVIVMEDGCKRSCDHLDYTYHRFYPSSAGLFTYTPSECWCKDTEGRPIHIGR